MTLRVIENSGYMRGNARSIWAARKALADTRGFVLAMSDHVVDPGLTRALVAEAGDRCRLAVELTDAWDGRADEATRALVDDRGRVVALGKNIGVWNALDTGVFWCTPAIFGALQPPLRDGEAGAVFAELAAIGELDAIDVTGHAWIDIDTPEDFRDAELLVRKMRVSSASEPPTMAS
jgi:choline kinase